MGPSIRPFPEHDFCSLAPAFVNADELPLDLRRNVMQQNARLVAARLTHLPHSGHHARRIAPKSVHIRQGAVCDE